MLSDFIYKVDEYCRKEYEWIFLLKYSNILVAISQLICKVLMRKGIYYIEYQSFCPVVWIGFPPPPHPSESPPPRIWVLGGDTLASGEGGGDLIQTTGHKLWYSLHSSYPFTLYWSNKRSEIAEKYGGFCPFKNSDKKVPHMIGLNICAVFFSTFISFSLFCLANVSLCKTARDEN